MTSEEERIVAIDKRQETFETYTRENLKSIRQQQESFEVFMRNYIDLNERNLAEMKADARDFKNQMTNQFHNLLIAGGVGLATILAGMVAMVVALKP